MSETVDETAGKGAKDVATAATTTEHDTPNFTILPILRTSTIDPGDTIRADLYFVGAGHIKKSQIMIAHDHPELIGNNIGEISLNVIRVGVEMLRGEDAEESDWDADRELNEAGGWLSFDSEYFDAVPESPDGLDYPIPYLGTRYEQEPPVCYTIETPCNATWGDYPIAFVFTYEGPDGEIQQVKESLTVHVRSKTEQRKWLVRLATIAAAVIALVSLIITAYGVYASV